MEDYSKLLPYIDSDLDDFKVFTSYLNKEIDYSKASFNLYDSKITSWEEVGNVTKIGGYLGLYKTPITSLGNLQSVGGDLNLYNTPITSLGNLKSVGGYLNLAGTPITTLGNLKSVGGALNLYNTPNLKDFGKLKEVRSKIYYDRGTKVEELLKERNLI